MNTRQSFSKIGAIVMACLLCALTASAYDFYVGGLYYQITSSYSVAVTNQSNSAGDYTGNITVPSVVTYDGNAYNVTSIAYRAFAECSGLTSVTLPSTINTIGEQAFIRCTSLTSITIPEGVEDIGNNAFEGCSSLATVNFPTSLSYIGAVAFVDCESLTSIVLPAELDSIGVGAFVYCDGITSITSNAYRPPKLCSNNRWPSPFTSTVLSNATLRLPNGYAWETYQRTTGWEDFSKFAYVRYYDYIYMDVYYSKTSETTLAACAESPSYNSYSGSVTVRSDFSTPDGKTWETTEITPCAFRNCTNLTYVSLPQDVRIIGDFAFNGCTRMQAFGIAQSRVREIGNNAFCNVALTTISFPSTLQTIGMYAFYGCPELTEVTLPEYVTTVGAYAFASCPKIETVFIGERCTSIGDGGFNGCSALESVICKATTPPTIGFYTWRIDYNNFTTAMLTVPHSSLSAYQQAEYWKDFSSFNTCYDFEKDGRYYKKLGSSGGYNYACLTRKDNTIATSYYYGDFSIGNTVTDDDNVTYRISGIDEYTFAGCTDLTSITMGSYINSIGEYAFASCTGLTGVSIPNQVHKIPKSCFQYCTGLQTINLPSSLDTLAYMSFYNCTALQKIVLPASTKFLAGRNFQNCTSLTSITCKGATPPTIAQQNVFDSDHYANATLTVPCSGFSAYQSAYFWKDFSNYHVTYDFKVNGIYYKITNQTQNLVSVTYGDNYGCYSGAVVIPEQVTYNGTTYTVTSIDANTFTACTGLTSVTIPATVTTVFYTFFNNQATSLNSILCLAIDPPYGMTQMTSDQYTNTIVFVPKNSVEAYQADEGWGQFARLSPMIYDFERDGLYYEITGENEVQVTYGSTDYNSYSGAIVIPETVTLADVTYNVTAVGDHVFDDCSGLTSISLPTSVKTVGEYAFYNCTGLTGINLTNVETIAAYAFAGCTGITSAVVNRQLESIDGTSFLECSSLTKFTMPSGTGVAGSYYIDNGVLIKRLPQTLIIYPGGKTNTSYTIPDGTVAVGPYAFAGSKVKTVEMPSTLTSIESRAFANCDRIQTIEIIKGVTSIGDYAFAGCDALTQVVLPSTLTTLGAGAFHGDEALSVVGTKDKTPASCETIIVNPRTGETLTSFDTDHFSTVTLLVPTGCRAIYKAASVWKLFSTVYESSSMDEEEDVLLGDVDGDGQVNISDVTTLIDYLLGAAGDINTDNADVNGDGSIDITDVTALIDMLLGGN